MAEKAYEKAAKAYTGRTRNLHERVMKDYLAFCYCHHITDITAVGPLMAFIQMKIDRKLNHRTIMNYVSSLKQYMKKVGYRTTSFDHETVKRLLHAISRIPVTVIPKGVFNVEQIDALFKVNQSMNTLTPYVATFALGLFAFLRISNLVPVASDAFDYGKQLIDDDIIWGPNGAKVKIRWAKNLQRSDQYHEVAVPRLRARPHICPTRILAHLLANHHRNSCRALIAWNGFVLTERQLRERLAHIVEMLGLSNRGLTFHALRRSGVTLAFQSNASMDSIQAHGAWASDSAWQYLKHTDRATERVPRALATLFQ